MSEAKNEPLEIERRFLIRRPSEQTLLGVLRATPREIRQTYLVAPEGWSSERVRMSRTSSGVIYAHTRKCRLSRMAAIEEEAEITEAEYEELLQRADRSRRVLEKCRYTFTRGERTYEIDLYPFWRRCAILEVELPSEDALLPIPEELSVIREITGERCYSNHALALSVPDEPCL